MGPSVMFLYRQKDIILIPFPFSDGATTKKRPVLIVSCDAINQNAHAPDFVGMMVTTSTRPSPYRVELSVGSLAEGNLPDQSCIRCDKIASILKDKAIKKLATTNDATFKAVVKGLDDVIGRSPEQAGP